ncbi:MAG: GNAT family N-acetyltransferase [Hydrogenophaga sp.]|uniref:GNAT family N-acetyltransferase n=1 Tax=Hydrogenophaga sp. TaxID=1904254 RepID=UPI002623D122|nr:GNAT family N-acetyltransferase [Hydrogenophaga sp.]MDM7942670.1 GNAT family N-acetyltransferase [Hydrogenophaga sp.]
MSEFDYVTRVFSSPAQIEESAWNALLALEPDPSPFMRHEYLVALHESGSARPRAGWQAQFVTLWRAGELQAACPMYLKNNSYGEYVFDWAWANAYAQHGLDYYPKALVAVPFTPVPGARLLARNASARAALVKALIQHVRNEDLSSVHLLFAQPADVAACEEAGMMLRHTVQFHWKNEAPGAAGLSSSFTSFEHFLSSLQQEKRKKIRQERRKVTDAGVTFRWSRGADITGSDWDFFYRCYERTYLEHGNAPYLNRDFFRRMAQTLPQHWLLFVAEREGRAIACSLIGIDETARVAYGRYWGALERVDCLHFEACYYAPLAWCIEHNFRRFEGGAQGEHKMARALLPVRTTSAHWLAHPSFAEAVERFLEREGQGIGQYMDHLAGRNPLKPGLAVRAPAPPVTEL